MILTWSLLFVLSIVAYVFISVFAQLTGGAPGSVFDAAKAVLKPVPIILILVANVAFAMAVDLGFKGGTQFAVPIVIAIGIIVSFIYSVFVLGGVVTPVRVGAVALILLGIYFLR